MAAQHQHGTALAPLAYHREVAAHLEAAEPELWRWMGASDIVSAGLEDLKAELLRSTYRLDRDGHPEVVGPAETAAAALGVTVPVRIYQAEGDLAPNAALVFVPDEAVILLSGPIAELLDAAELTALFGHELAHHVLWTLDGGRHLLTDRLVRALVADQPTDALAETERRLALTTELFADRGALAASGDLAATVATLVKAATGMRSVSSEAYLRQADEVLAAAPRASDGTTHPETFLRAAAVRDWADGLDQDQSATGALVRGRLDVDRLDLLDQAALATLTRRTIEALLDPEWLRTDTVLAHARAFFPDLRPAARAPLPVLPELPRSTARYLGYVLLDFAVIDPDLDHAAVAEALAVATLLGLGDTLGTLVRDELSLSSADRALVDRTAEQRAFERSSGAPP